MILSFNFIKKYKLIFSVFGVFFVVFCVWWYFFSLPKPLFNKPYSFIMESGKGELLGALISEDEQWRFPPPDSVPQVYIDALLLFEDKRFYKHIGIDPLAILRATRDNIKNKSIVSGGSTITMQLARLIRNSEKRTFRDKIIEAFMTLRLELKYSKDEILILYAAHAPYGGNVVGLEAASWRYFGYGPELLSRAQAATLAVLPNSPSLIHPGRKREVLLLKRNRLLTRMHQAGYFDKISLELYIDEPLAGQPSPMPLYSPQLLQRAKSEYGHSTYRLKSTIDPDLQKTVNRLVKLHASRLKFNHIEHLAVLVLDVKKNEVLAYTANVPDADPQIRGNQVDLIMGRRSTGSILKPFLYAGMLTEGVILPASLVPDIPTQIGSYAPQNYNLGYDGAIPAYRALARSLNVPAVRMLRNYGLERFHRLLKQTGKTTLDFGPAHYGLTLVLGGAEGTLWDLASMYAGMSRTLNNYHDLSGRYYSNTYDKPLYIRSKQEQAEIIESLPLNAGSVWHTMEALLDVERPGSERGWNVLRPSQKIAWKTGTSFGFRDGWAIGTTPDYVVAVWAGNASGEGRPGLTGIGTAAPLMFDVFNHLNLPAKWFRIPHDDLIELLLCTESGYKAGFACRSVDTSLVPVNAERSGLCPYHRMLNVDSQMRWQVHAGCEPLESVTQKSWFVLPPAIAHYYRQVHASYKTLPAFREDCEDFEENNTIELIYPRHHARLKIPVELDGEKSNVIFEASHQRQNAVIFWHLNNSYLGSTQDFHKMALNPPPGNHSLTLVDENGNSLNFMFDVVW